MTLAAEAPDLDVLGNFKGPVFGFAHHRGFTHSFLGSFLVAAVVVGLLGAFLLITGIQMQAAIQASSQAQVSQAMQMSDFVQSYSNLGMLTKYVLALLPALLGMFVGAPMLAREMDRPPG